MTLRTPRRRVSPRTRKRYRAIKDFFKRAIGSSSQPDIEINSCIAVNVTDLNRKIVGLEQQLSEVSRTCREFIYLDGSRESQNLFPTALKDDIRRDDSERRNEREPHGVETKILYKTSESHYRKSEGSDYTPKHNIEIDDDNQNNSMNDFNTNATTSRKKMSKVDTRVKDFDMNQKFRKPKTKSVYENIVSSYSTSNFHSLTELSAVRHPNPGYSGDHADRRCHQREHNVHSHQRDEIRNELLKRVVPKNYEQQLEERAAKHSKNRKYKQRANKLDQDFIADIIQRQYKPVKMFGKRESDLSQFSEPMCRDREFTLNENIQEDAELCSCCYGGRHSPKQNRNAKSVCDARLYSSKINPRFKYRRVHADEYNDSEQYDLIPVKEKSSPKTRRKFTHDHMVNYGYREVPPSPKTHRPRLNLKAQCYTESDDHMDFVRKGKKRVSPKRHHKYHEPIETLDSDYSSQLHYTTEKKQQTILKKQDQIHQEMGTMSSLQYPQHFDIDHNNTTVDTALNKTQETSTEKTDRALCEIKDILQTFLQEIKKEASSSGKSDVSTKITENCVSNLNPQVNTNVMPNSGHSFNNCNAPQCSSAPTPYMPPYANACCYPVLPMYPMNCMQNSYVMPSQSFTCGCANKTEDLKDNKSKPNNNTGNETFASETDELIKEIYKFVAQSPTFSRKHDDICITENQARNVFENRLLTSRSAGGSTHISKHDAKVGTPKMKCYSKSCEAIGSRMISDTYYSGTTGTYSDTILENLSLEATAETSSETEPSTERSEKNKAKNTRLGKVLQSFGLFKKKKKDAIEEVSESESTIDVVIQKKPPFRQEITNYTMHGQEYYRPPPVPEEYRHHYSQDYRHPYNPAMHNYPPPPTNDPYHDPRMHQLHEQPPPNYHPGHPSAPPCTYESYNQMQPQVPLCLKEIEVKSMGTQSERKMSFFRKIKQKVQPPVEQVRNDGARAFATQTSENKPGFWKTWQAKAMEGKNDSMAYSYKEQQKLAAGDVKMRNAMLKKMFNKRNPFSPRNLIVRTLMGRDKSSFGDPPAMYRPRMFI